MQAASPKIYFPGLNGLRFFAALAVLVTHVELLKGQCGFPNRWSNPVFFNSGGLGVYFFFVLSGFLITYLLLVEKKHTGTIQVRAFYMRRIFRIWPLYYLLVLLGFFVFPHIDMLGLSWLDKFMPGDFWQKFLLFFLMLPNMAIALYHAVPHIGQLWSIGVEEQFYIAWPWIIKKSRRILPVIIWIGTGIVVFKMIVWLLAHNYPGNRPLEVFKTFVAATKMECMALGACGAYLAFVKNEKLLKLVFHPLSQALSYLAIPVLIYFTPAQFQDGIHLVYSVAFLVIIMNVSLNKSSFLKLENKLLNYLGEISYGIYMYHMFIIVLVVKNTYMILPRSSPWVYDIAIYGFSILLTVLVSSVSFYAYEKPFIRLKRRFTSIISGADAKKEAA